VVRYRLTLSGGEVDRLGAWVDQPGTERIAIAAADQEAALSASTAERTLTCTAFDEDGLRHFAADWVPR
jgi:hypothetical protein